ncbi:BQ5605_C010g05896 [Microbotryum silenes-dioicae]|uniref:BQ5605_C010g05896 protein n=1 Tax=Microbotryum silenes-dioicae TaxID=796604 RepID=A0A2X0NTW6_9BASI|nr:BQ5605_C010g05896 [Microbotryum silenes-dioicae]
MGAHLGDVSSCDGPEVTKAIQTFSHSESPNDVSFVFRRDAKCFTLLYLAFRESVL